jgi:hypothetical protein
MQRERGNPQQRVARSYHSHPTAEAYAAFKKQGYALARPAEFMRAVRQHVRAQRERTDAKEIMTNG